MCSHEITFVGLIFTLQARKGTLPSSVSSEERDRRPGVIPATDIPQDQWPTFDAAASSGLSQGCVSGNQWPSPGQRNDLSAARRVENPEVNIKSEVKTEVILTVVGCKHIAGVSLKGYEALICCNRHLQTEFLCHSKYSHPHLLKKPIKFR
jgi:hypothetical protein